MIKKFWPLLLLLTGCSPLKTSPYDQGYQMELTLHEVKTNLDDIKHDMNSFTAQMQVFDARIRHYEDILAAVKQLDLGQQSQKLDQLTYNLGQLEKRWNGLEKSKAKESEELTHLITHAKETSLALGQCKGRIEELEQELAEVTKLKGNIEKLAKAVRGEAKTYKVRPGDTLEKIARLHQTTAEKIRKLNSLEQDLIVVGQELKLP
jgi:LysM repeat protein